MGDKFIETTDINNNRHFINVIDIADLKENGSNTTITLFVHNEKGLPLIVESNEDYKTIKDKIQQSRIS